MTKEKKQEFTLRISQANRTEMMVILYDILLVYLQDALQAKKDEGFTEFFAAIANGRNCLNELMDSVHIEQAPAAGFFQIYSFLDLQLARTLSSGSTKEIHDVVEIIEKMQKTYLEVSKQDQSSSVMGNAENVYAGLTYGKGMLNESVEDPTKNRGFRI